MSFTSDLEEVKSKVESVLEGVKNAEPTLAELVFKAVEQVFLDAGYTAPAVTEATDVETAPNAQ
jgi:hypothetical protein